MIKNPVVNNDQRWLITAVLLRVGLPKKVEREVKSRKGRAVEQDNGRGSGKRWQNEMARSGDLANGEHTSRFPSLAVAVGRGRQDEEKMRTLTVCCHGNLDRSAPLRDTEATVGITGIHDVRAVAEEQ